MSDNDRGYGYEPDEEDDDYYTYDATDDDEDGRRRPIVILAIVALIVVFAGVVFLAYKQGLKQGAQGNPPVIRADDTPVKVAPANPGGMEFPHQDKTVYDRISGNEGKQQGADGEHLLPSPEEPMAVKPAEPAPAQTAPAQPARNQTAANAPVQQQGMPSVTAAPTAPVEQRPAAPQSPATVQPEPQAAAPVEEAAPAETAPAATAGGYVVQLAAFRDEPTARAEFRKLQKKHTGLAGLTADIQKADLGAKGIYYRLRAGYMDKTRAASLCAALKGEGQACLVKPR